MTTLLYAYIFWAFACTTDYIITSEAADCNTPPTGSENNPSSVAGTVKRARMVPKRTTGTNIDRVRKVLPETLFKAFFPSANLACGPTSEPYNYANFIRAVGLFPYFCDDLPTGSSLSRDDVCKVELATLFAHFSQETGRGCPLNASTTGLYYFEEVNCYMPGHCTGYTAPSAIYPPTPGQRYYGRGPFQLSYNYNYGPFSQAVYGDMKVLLDNPDLLVSSDPQYGWLAFAAALWFYMSPQSPKPSMHDVVAGHWPNEIETSQLIQRGFGATTNIINGGIECRQDYKSIRIEAYEGYCKSFGVSNLCNYGRKDCNKMPDFPQAKIPLYFGDDGACRCSLKTYQTAFPLYSYPSDEAAYRACVSSQASCQCASNIPKGTFEPQPPPANNWLPLRTKCPKCPTVRGSGSGVFAECKKVVAVPNNPQGVTDEQCDACTFGAQAWWPCNLPGLCKCADSQHQGNKPQQEPDQKPGNKPQQEPDHNSGVIIKPKSACAISSTIQAVIISSAVLLYLYTIGY